MDEQFVLAIIDDIKCWRISQEVTVCHFYHEGFHSLSACHVHDQKIILVVMDVLWIHLVIFEACQL